MPKDSATHTDNGNWSYNEFLAFLMIYGAEMNQVLTQHELDFIKTRTGIHDIEKIKAKVDGISDAEALEIIDDYKALYLPTAESKSKVKNDLEGLLNTPGTHSQFEKVVVHLMERLLK
jgi:hypothetical protein